MQNRQSIQDLMVPPPTSALLHQCAQHPCEAEILAPKVPLHLRPFPTLCPYPGVPPPLLSIFQRPCSQPPPPKSLLTKAALTHEPSSGFLFLSVPAVTGLGSGLPPALPQPCACNQVTVSTTLHKRHSNRAAHPPLQILTKNIAGAQHHLALGWQTQMKVKSKTG